ncbi:ABC transporter substrate-binding protein [Nocardioides sp. 31GB23]|uniref:ABC transporter substrate-binding protein n=1 Tax=Nocardioides sp. 31GB23 TaxID=3156065 RepID=UPI0032AED2CA
MTRRSIGSKRVAAVLSIGVVLMAAACSGGDDDDAQGADGSSGNGQLKVSMPVIPPNFVHVMPWVAQDQGFYDDFGVDVELVSLDSGVTALRGAEAGSADIAAVPTPTLINAVAQGGSAKAFYTYSPNLDVQMVVSEDIGSCEELEGQVVGVDEVGGFAEVLTKKFYTSCGLTQDDVKYGNFPGAEGQAIAQGQAVSGVLHIDEAAGVMQQFPDAGLKSLVNLWEVVPDWHYAGYAAPTDLLEEKRDEMVAFTAANIAANEFMSDSANKEAVLDTAVEVTGLDREILSDTYDTFLEDGLFPSDNGYPQDMVDYTADQQVELGNIEEGDKPAYEDLVDTSIYEDARALVDEQS